MKAKAAREVSFVELSIEERRAKRDPPAKRGIISLSTRSEFLEERVFQVSPPLQTGE